MTEEAAVSAEVFQVGFEDLSPAARIREVALRLFAEHGVRGTSMRRVATAVGVSPGAVLHHFPTKQDLQTAVQRHVVARIHQAISGVGLEDPTMVAMTKRRRAFAQLLATSPEIGDYVRQVLWDGGPEGVELLRQQLDVVRTEMQTMTDAGITRPLPDPDVELAVYWLVVSARILLKPLLEQALDLDFSDPTVGERLDKAEIDLLTRALFVTRPE